MKVEVPSGEARMFRSKVFEWNQALALLSRAWDGVKGIKAASNEATLAGSKPKLVHIDTRRLELRRELGRTYIQTLRTNL